MTPPSPDEHCDWLSLSQMENAPQSLPFGEGLREDTAAVAAAVAWLTRTGQPLEAMAFAEMAWNRQPVNVAATQVSYEQMDSESQAWRKKSATWRWLAEGDEIAMLPVRADEELPPPRRVWHLSQSHTDACVPSCSGPKLCWTESVGSAQTVGSVDAIRAQVRLQPARCWVPSGTMPALSSSMLLSNDPNNPELLGTAALLDFELEFFEAALEKFQQLVVVGERLDESYYYIGRIEMSGRAEAIEAFGSVGRRG